MKLVYYLTVGFAAIWFRKRSIEESVPVEWTLAYLKARYDVDNINKKPYYLRCSVALQDPGVAEIMVEELSKALKERLQIGPEEKAFSIQCEAGAPFGGDRAEAGESLDRILSLIGAQEFKALAKECVSVASGVKENGLTDVFLRRAYLVSVNDGCGLSTCLKLFAQLLQSLGLFTFSQKDDPVRELSLPPLSPDANVEKEVRSFMRGLIDYEKRLVCIDLSEWMDRLADPPIRELMRSLQQAMGTYIFFFRVPFVERSVLRRIAANLGDVLSVRAISVPPFSPEELRQHAELRLAQKHFSAQEDVWPLFFARVAAEQSDGRFYGIDTVDKVVDEMLYMKLLSNAQNAASDTCIRREDVLPLADDRYSEAPGMEQLDALVGVEAIKDRILELLAQIELAARREGPDHPSIHMRFVGAPGTGKTTVARIMGKILAERGVLRNGAFFEHAGRDLCGRYVGQTAPKTAAICRDAYGGVLFIDEAYSLFRAGNEDTPDYGQEAIDTLIAEMENHRTDLLVIFAGYPDEMETLMKANPGLAGRMPYQIDFPNYTRAQLAEIFFRFAEKSFAFGDGFRAAVTAYFDSLSSAVLEDKDFGNARFVRNLYERTWGKAALRCQLQDLPCDTLTAEDFTLAAAEKDFQQATDRKKLGF